ncbi:LPS export ABC transporter permease LptF [Psychrobacter sp. I-STPA10]|uniref:LPS export ABC transporter permease LptF n=1 Tax=Psychrobacter sp. I-STPA10 TaxID=2585769 RepID=UPI001E4B4E82|nr:LPS export ABC transporter permease LptF [Psychrobacter sp. I-STPA10]
MSHFATIAKVANHKRLFVILRRYITQQVASTTAIVLGFLVVLLLGGRLIRYFGIAAEGRLDVGLLFSIIGYNLPYFLELILPLSFFIGLMLVFGRLYVDHEMAVINGSGISRGRLARLMTPLIVLLFVIEAGLSLYGKPWGVRHAESVWQQQALSSAFDLIRPKQFISSNDYHLYVGSFSEDKKQLQDVILIQSKSKQNNRESTGSDDVLESEVINNRDQTNNTAAHTHTNSSDFARLPTMPKQLEAKDTVILAKRAVQVEGEEDSPTTQIDLYQGRRYEIGADSLVYNQVSFEKYRISMTKPSTETVTSDNISAQTLPKLWCSATQSNTAATGVIAKLPAQAELGYRFALPWLMIIAPMLAVPLAQVRPRQGRWLRLLPAILIFASCALVLMSLKNIVSKGTLGVWTYPITIVAFMVVALYMNWASRIHHRLRFGFSRQSVLHSDDSHDGNDSNVGGR